MYKNKKGLIAFSIIISIIFNILFLQMYSVLALEGKLNTSNIRVRKETNTTSDIITNLYKTDSVEILGKTGEWYKIKTEEGKIGYIKTEFVDTSGEVKELSENEKKEEIKEPKSDKEKTEVKQETKIEKEEVKPKEETKTKLAEKTEYTLKNDSTLKTFPIYYSNDIKTLEKGTKVTKENEKGNWIKVVSDKNVGWISKTDVE